MSEQNYRDFSIGEAERNEIIHFDTLYRINANKNGKYPVLMEGPQEFLEEHFQTELTNGTVEIDDQDHYQLTESGKKELKQFGEMYQKFKDLSIFKCVYPDGPAPEGDDQPDERFGSFEEEANPPQSEDYRIAIFENFMKRQKRRAPLHIVSYFSMLEHQDLEKNEWIWGLASGEIFEVLKENIDSQVSAEAIAPEGWSEDEIIDEIFNAGMQELNRVIGDDDEDLSQDDLNRNDREFFVEEIVEEEPDYFYRGPAYYDPYYDINVGAAFCVGAFAGLATCAILF